MSLIVVLLKYTEGIMTKMSTQKNKKVFDKFSLKKNDSASAPNKNKTRSFIFITFHSVKRNGKQLVKRMLLSRLFQKFFKVAVGVFIFSVSAYGIYLYFDNSLANDVVVSESEIIDRISKLTSVPGEDPDDMKRVEDAESLKKQNIFFENIKNGDYIIIYPKLAIIYDLRNNKIVAIKKSEER